MIANIDQVAMPFEESTQFWWFRIDTGRMEWNDFQRSIFKLVSRGLPACIGAEDKWSTIVGKKMPAWSSTSTRLAMASNAWS